MRTWLTTREVAQLLGVGMPRVSRLRTEGQLVGTIDSDGRVRYDRAQVENFARERAALLQDDQETRERLRVEHAMAQQRAWRERRQEKDEQREREDRRDALLERIATGIERMARGR